MTRMSSRSVGCPLILGAASGKAAIMSAFDVDRIACDDMVDRCRGCETGSDVGVGGAAWRWWSTLLSRLFVSSTETY